MSTPKFKRAIQHFSRQLRQFTADLGRGFVNWLLRGLLLLGRQPVVQRAGFVLPVTVLLVLVLTLTVGAIGFRTYTRTVATIGERQQRVIYNAATPAIDRARAKLEFLFDSRRDPRMNSGVPEEGRMISMMKNDGSVPPVVTVAGQDAYTFPDETRIDIGNSGADDTGNDNAWTYREDLNDDGTADATVVYSIITRTPNPLANLNNAGEADVAARAQALQVRHGPLSNPSQVNPACASATVNVNPEQGWIPDATQTSTLRRAFQVDVFVQPDATNGTVSTLEFFQDREVQRGNRWGAWFRNDLEIFPGPQFNWNGAMHTEGNLIIGNNSFDAYMISSHNSCFYTKDSSVISVTEISQNDALGIPAFNGEFMSGKMGNNRFENENIIHIWDGAGQQPTTGGNDVRFNRDTDSTENSGGPVQYSLDPVVLQTQDISQARNPARNIAGREGAWFGRAYVQKGRFESEQQPPPYVDDTFRADNRWGPKPRYKSYELDVSLSRGAGSDIGNIPDLVRNTPPIDTVEYGLDGYWERRARRDGLRIIVGQRLELGDPMGWGGYTLDPEDEPLKPWPGCGGSNSNTRCHEARQRKTLWDNLAAVQVATVYHAADPAGDPDTPIACFVSTVHPGTSYTLASSSTFQDLTDLTPNALNPNPDLKTAAILGDYANATNSPVISNFFHGIGTNGWEFTYDPEILDNAEMQKALDNLAHLAGDPFGGAPSFPSQQDSNVNPYPLMSMWGDFANLRRILDGGTSYANLSPADKTTLHNAACMIGALAYNVDYLEQFNPINVPNTLMGTPGLNLADTGLGNGPAGDPYWQGLRGHIRRILARDTDFDEIDNSPAFNQAFGTDYDRRHPEVWLRLLERWRDLTIRQGVKRGVTVADLNNSITLARLILDKEQVARDRAYGFGGDIDGSGLAPDDLYAPAPLGFCNLWRKEAKRQNPGSQLVYRTFSNPGTGDLIDLPPVDNNNAGRIEHREEHEPLAMLCSDVPRYPALHALFPADQEVTGPWATGDGEDPFTFDSNGQGLSQHTKNTYDPTQIVRASFQDVGEGVNIRDPEDRNSPYIAAVNTGYNYKVVTPEDVRILPRPLTMAGWKLPHVTDTNDKRTNSPNHNRRTLIRICPDGDCLVYDDPFLDNLGQNMNNINADPTVTGIGTPQLEQIPFKDTAPYNGREMMVTRMMDVNLGLIRSSTANLANGDHWLPDNGIIYAFREDAVSEQNIVRPAQTAWTSCDDDAGIQTDACKMDARGNALSGSFDPPLYPDNLITPKPVDYLPDPDRRPNGFRLKNGKRIDRASDNPNGMSFISYNPLYVQGDFNCHLALGNADRACNSQYRLEEFTDLLPENFNVPQFYGNREDLDPNFAQPDSDLWRPAELLADAISLISDDYCDGSIEDTFLSAGNNNDLDVDIYNRYGCSSGNHRTSYLNQNKPDSLPGDNDEGMRWLRANLADSMGYGNSRNDERAGGSPVMLTRENNPVHFVNNRPGYLDLYTRVYDDGYYPMTQNKRLMDGIAGTRVNAVVVSGLVPSREDQSYGGLHNFPRFLENWGRSLFIQGSLLQLNFSNQATGPFDQRAFERNDNPGGELIKYYGPPNRRWGYDVGLQYAPAGPVASRFTQVGSNKSEFYNEPPADDPYIRNLCEAINGAGNCP